jgi:site-specific recombinase XerD
VQEARAWLRLNPQLRGEAVLLPNRSGTSMTRSNVARRLELAVKRAQSQHPTLSAYP